MEIKRLKSKAYSNLGKIFAKTKMIRLDCERCVFFKLKRSVAQHNNIKPLPTNNWVVLLRRNKKKSQLYYRQAYKYDFNLHRFIPVNYASSKLFFTRNPKWRGTKKTSSSPNSSCILHQCICLEFRPYIQPHQGLRSRLV